MKPSPQNPGWLEIAVDIHPVAHEALGAHFFDLGCDGLVTQSFHDRVFRAYLPRSLDSKGFRTNLASFVRRIQVIFPEVESPKASFRILKSEDWNRLWRKHYRPLRITEKLTVLPAWEDVSFLPGVILIRMDPGPAFGTGGHATTRMCLKAVERCAPSGNWSMLDAGTGSGILAIFAAKLGACKVLAIDNDPEALRWAERNITLNGLSDSVELSSQSLQHIGERFTIITANLILDTILELLPHFSRLCEPGGWLILSGLLREQAPQVERALDQAGFCDVRALHEEEWACIIGKREEWSTGVVES